MFRNYLAAALRNLAHNKLYATISIVGLSVGLCAAILAALLIRNHLTHDRFVHGYEHTYMGISVLQPKGRAPDYSASTHSSLARYLRLRVPGVEAVTRLTPQIVTLRRGSIEAKETIYWADPNVFDVLPVPVVSGDLRSALRRPDSIVLSTSKARKYFGDAEAVGRTIHFDGLRPMIVAAVIEDFPREGTNLESDIFASGLTSTSELARLDRSDRTRRSDATAGFAISVRTYLRLAPNTSVADVQDTTQSLTNELWPRRPPGVEYSVELVGIDKVHLHPGLNPGIRGRIAVNATVGALILLLACVNFVGLSTARSTRRATEVAIRKVTGANRGTLVLQFLGEALVYVVIATVVAIAFAEMLLPFVNAFLGTGASFSYWREPALVLMLAAGSLALATIVGVYPALVMSAFGPIHNPKAMTSSLRASVLRRGLVVVQFAILIGLSIAAAVAYQQRAYAVNEASRADTDQVLLIQSMCDPAFRNELRTVEGVRDVACTGWPLLTGAQFDNIELQHGSALAISVMPIGSGLLELHGLEPIAGRFFSAGDYAGAIGSVDRPLLAKRSIINETAVRALGFISAEAVIGQAVGSYGEIIGVVPDFSFSSVDQEINPTLYIQDPTAFDLVSVKLTGRVIPETLAAIDNLLKATGHAKPGDRFFLDDHIDGLYRGLLREAQALAIFSIVAVVLACLGLFGLSASAAERRTKEIGVRKAMGAGTPDIVWLLVYQFAKPVLLANIIAWPLAAFAMNEWLNGFARRVDINAWVFVAVSASALGIALTTVGMHCYVVGRAKPADALRYE